MARVRELSPLWARWVAANAAGELLGLGGAGLLVAAIALHAPSFPRSAALAGIVALGTMEGAIVGLAQWLVLRRSAPDLQARVWITATAGGAAVAWILGLLPSTIVEMTGHGGPPGAPAPELHPALELALAAGLGAVGGPVLAMFQWRALRRHVAHAAWWIPANSLAWALAMPIVFLAASSAPTGVSAGARALLLVAAAGAVAGAIHGLALIRLLRTR